MKSHLILGVDVDGCIANFVDSFCSIVNILYPGRMEKGYQPPSYDFGGKLSAEEFKQCIDYIKVHPSQDRFWQNLEPLPGCDELYENYPNSNDATIYYITKRFDTGGESCMKQTQFWLGGYNLLWTNSSVIVVPESDAKVDIVQALGIKYLIDDHPETIKQCLAIPGHRPYLMDAPWNRKAEYVHLPRVESVAQFLRIVFDKPENKSLTEPVAV